MTECKGFISSIYHGTAVDGPGIRSIIFMAGCNMRCPFCHNPETFDIKGGREYTAKELCNIVLRYKNYIIKGGVTFSGGEPFLQAKFCARTAEMLKNEGINIAVETNCGIINKELLQLADIIIADIKNQGGGISVNTVKFLDICAQMNKPVIMTNVLIKGVNDGGDKIKELKVLYNIYKNITKFEFLPFKKLCADKYKKLGLAFPYENYEETDNGYAAIMLNEFYRL